MGFSMTQHAKSYKFKEKDMIIEEDSEINDDSERSFTDVSKMFYKKEGNLQKNSQKIKKNEEENSASSNSATHTEEKNNNTEAVQNNDGVYSFHDNSVDLKIVIHGQTWTGKTTIITGMGEEYDKPEYQSGIVIGNDIYESSGNIKIGSVNGRSLTTTISDSQVTLTK